MAVEVDFDRLEAKVLNGERLDFEDGMALFQSHDIFRIGYLANLVRERIHQNKAYFITNQHINYTNICRNGCRFCAFSKQAGEPGAYVLSISDILDKIKDKVAAGIREFHIVGGLNPELPFNYYIEMLSALKERFPQIHIQAFTAVEIAFLAEISGLTVEDTLRQLREAGLGSLPGGGAEVFSPRIRTLLCENKLSGSLWLQVMRQAHRLGIHSNATMLYGHLESYEERIQHLLELRQLQDETCGFLAFIPLAFHPKNTKLEGLNYTTAMDDLKTLAISRLMLDNFPHIKAFWIMLGEALAQVALSFGVDDMDGTVIEEKITHSAGAHTAEELTRNQLIRLIRQAGRQPVERDTLYQQLAEVNN